MALLVLGLILFIAVHLFPTFPNKRESLIESMGRLPYLTFFSAISSVALFLIIYGYMQTDKTVLWQPLPFGRSLALAVMPFVFILVASAYLKSHIRSKLRYPMLIGTAIWAIVHLTTTGSAPSAILFGSFLFYAIADMAMSKPRQSLIPSGPPSKIHDLIAAMLGLALYATVLYGHGILFGVNIVGIK